MLILLKELAQLLTGSVNLHLDVAGADAGDACNVIVAQLAVRSQAQQFPFQGIQRPQSRQDPAVGFFDDQGRFLIRSAATVGLLNRLLAAAAPAPVDDGIAADGEEQPDIRLLPPVALPVAQVAVLEHIRGAFGITGQTYQEIVETPAGFRIKFLKF